VKSCIFLIASWNGHSDAVVVLTPGMEPPVFTAHGTNRPQSYSETTHKRQSQMLHRDYNSSNTIHSASFAQLSWFISRLIFGALCLHSIVDGTPASVGTNSIA
jgi:hypothetical protein